MESDSSSLTLKIDIFFIIVPKYIFDQHCLTWKKQKTKKEKQNIMNTGLKEWGK